MREHAVSLLDFHVPQVARRQHGRGEQELGVVPGPRRPLPVAGGHRGKLVGDADLEGALADVAGPVPVVPQERLVVQVECQAEVFAVGDGLGQLLPWAEIVHVDPFQGGHEGRRLEQLVHRQRVEAVADAPVGDGGLEV